MKDRPRENSLEEGLHTDHIRRHLKYIIEFHVYEILSLLNRYKVQDYSQVPDKFVNQMNVLTQFFCTAK